MQHLIKQLLIRIDVSLDDELEQLLLTQPRDTVPTKAELVRQCLKLGIQQLKAVK
jgi:hypothetical protein